MTTTRLFGRGLAIALTTAAVFTATAVTASAQPEPLPAFDFADCPALPAGADPAKWRCEVLISHGTVRVGRLGELPLTRIRTVFAEGQLDGKFAQVFGSLAARPVRVPGGLFGNSVVPMDIRLEYAGFADFLSVGDRMGEQHLKLRVRSPLLPSTCTIGGDRDPIVFRPLRTGGPTEVSKNPPVFRFTMADTEFAVPGSHGCGPLRHVVERRLGVPTSGPNELNLTTYVSIKPYS